MTRRLYTKQLALLVIVVLLICSFLLGCGGDAGGPSSTPVPTGEGSRAVVPPIVAAPGEKSKTDGKKTVTVDYSNAHQGYYMVRSSTDGSKHVRVRAALKGADGSAYVYYLEPTEEFVAFPLIYGNGTYTITVMEHKQTKEQERAEKRSSNEAVLLLSFDVDVELENEYVPYLINTLYADFSDTSPVASIAEDLSKSANNDVDVIYSVFNYIATTITYDLTIAQKVKDKVITMPYPLDYNRILNEKTGICFDYASLMAAMLRSQGIPTKVIFGEVDGLEFDHAWVLVYTKEEGWIGKIVFFDGTNWQLMDPTQYSSDSKTKGFIGDGTGYIQVSVH